MVRMEIALFLVLGMVAFIFFTAERKVSRLHRTFSVFLIAVLIHLCFDGITIYTVNHLDTVPVIEFLQKHLSGPKSIFHHNIGENFLKKYDGEVYGKINNKENSGNFLLPASYSWSSFYSIGYS